MGAREVVGVLVPQVCLKEVASKVALEYGLKRLETGDSKDCEEAGVSKPLVP